MYRVTKRIILTEYGIHIGYGIKCDKYRFDDISKDRRKIEDLCDTCNRLGLAEEHLEDVVQDFLVDFEV